MNLFEFFGVGGLEPEGGLDAYSISAPSLRFLMIIRPVPTIQGFFTPLNP
jgi:hypothetical protein